MSNLSMAVDATIADLDFLDQYAVGIVQPVSSVPAIQPPRLTKPRNMKGALPSQLSKYVIGQLVEVNFRGKGLWYEARIVADKLDDFYDVIYSGGERDENVPLPWIRSSAKGALSMPTFNMPEPKRNPMPKSSEKLQSEQKKGVADSGKESKKGRIRSTPSHPRNASGRE